MDALKYFDNLAKRTIEYAKNNKLKFSSHSYEDEEFLMKWEKYFDISDDNAKACWLHMSMELPAGY